VLFKANAEDGEGIELAEEFSVQGYPTFVVVNNELETIDRWFGYDTAEDFVAQLDKSRADMTTIAAKRVRFEQQPTGSDAAALGSYHLTLDENAEAAKYYAAAVELGDPADGFEADYFYAVYRGFHDDAFTAEELDGAARAAMDATQMPPQDHADVALVMTRVAAGDESLDATSYIETALERLELSEDPDMDRTLKNLKVAHALHVAHDADLALTYKRQTLPEGWDDDAEELNGFAWWCFENEINLDEAERLARKGAELAEEPASKAMILDTAAEIRFLQGDTAEALALMRQAVELAPDNEYYQEQIVRFSGEDAETI
jgi:tetratricopeptide (TPR) repeat protein